MIQTKRGGFTPIAITVLLFLVVGTVIFLDSYFPSSIPTTGFAIDTPPVDWCNETDGGNDITNNGTVFFDENGPFNLPIYSTFADICLNYSSLSEYYCNTTNDTVEEQYLCNLGCLNNKCNSNTICSESDDGQDYPDSATTTGRNASNWTQSIALADFCVNNTILMEYYCGGTQDDFVLNTTSYCEFNCSSGECESCDTNWDCGNWTNCTNDRQLRTCTDLNICNDASDIPSINRTCTTCDSNWTCTDWSPCVTNHQTRICNDSNLCNTSREETQVCLTPCTPDWNCTDWSPERCPKKDETQTRNCTDNNNCVAPSPPLETQPCIYEPSFNWLLIIIISLISISIIGVGIVVIYMWNNNKNIGNPNINPYQPAPPPPRPPIQPRFPPSAPL